MCGPGKAHPFLTRALTKDELPTVLKASYTEIPVEVFKRQAIGLAASHTAKYTRKGQVTLARAHAAVSEGSEDEFWRVRWW